MKSALQPRDKHLLIWDKRAQEERGVWGSGECFSVATSFSADG